MLWRLARFAAGYLSYLSDRRILASSVNGTTPEVLRTKEALQASLQLAACQLVYFGTSSRTCLRYEDTPAGN